MLCEVLSIRGKVIIVVLLNGYIGFVKLFLNLYVYIYLGVLFFVLVREFCFIVDSGNC